LFTSSLQSGNDDIFVVAWHDDPNKRREVRGFGERRLKEKEKERAHFRDLLCVHKCA